MPDITAETLTNLWPKLKAPFDDPHALQHTASSDPAGWASVGLKSQYIVDRLNTLLGPAHWRLIEESTDCQFFADGQCAVLAKVRVEIGNPHFNPDTGLSTWEVIASEFGYGEHQALSRGDAFKGAISNAFKKAIALKGPGQEAYMGLLGDPDAVSTSLTGPHVPPGLVAATVKTGRKSEVKSADGTVTQFEGQLYLPETDQMVAVIARDTEAVLLQGYFKSRAPFHVELAPVAPDRAQFRALRVLAPADITPPATPSPIPLPDTEVQTTEHEAAAHQISWATIRVAYVTAQDEFATPTARADYLDALKVVIGAAKSFAPMVEHIDTAAKYAKLSAMAHTLLGLTHADSQKRLQEMNALVADQTPTAAHYRVAAKALFTDLLAYARDDTPSPVAQ